MIPVLLRPLTWYAKLHLSIRKIQWSSVRDDICSLDLLDMFLLSALAVIGALQYVDGRNLFHGIMLVWGLYQVAILVTLLVGWSMAASVQVCMLYIWLLLHC